MNDILQKSIDHACGIAKREYKIQSPQDGEQIDVLCNFVEGGIREYVAGMKPEHIAIVCFQGDNMDTILAACCKKTKETGTTERKLEEFLFCKAIAAIS